MYIHSTSAVGIRRNRALLISVASVVVSVYSSGLICCAFTRRKRVLVGLMLGTVAVVELCKLGRLLDAAVVDATPLQAIVKVGGGGGWLQTLV